MALAQLAHRTGIAAYLDGAVRLGNWIFNNTFDTRGAGGYNFTAGANQVKSTEHNIDAFALFTMLARLTGDAATWTGRADHARIFVDAMFNAPGGFFFTGTGPDGVSVNPNLSQDNIPEDVQDWSFQAFLNPDHAASIDWCKTNLAVTDTPQTYNSDLVPAFSTNLSGNIRVSGVACPELASPPKACGRRWRKTKLRKALASLRLRTRFPIDPVPVRYGWKEPGIWRLPCSAGIRPGARILMALTVMWTPRESCSTTFGSRRTTWVGDSTWAVDNPLSAWANRRKPFRMASA